MFFDSRNIPPCPDPERYVLVTTKEGKYWRRKKGSVKQVVLTGNFKMSNEMMKLSAPAARRIMTKLRPFTERMETGRMNAKISARIRKALNATGKAGLVCLEDMDLQPGRPLEQLLTAGYTITVKDGLLQLHIPIRHYTVKRNSQMVSGYFFELVLLYGDCMKENTLRIETEKSDVFGIDETNVECHMQMVLPEKEWIVLLKVSCVEGREMAKAARNYGMKVVGVGS